MSNKLQKISVKGLIYRDGNVLMLNDEKGNWELPGGKIDFGEHPEDSLKREFSEELNVENLTVGGLVDVWDFVVSKDNIDYQFIIVVYWCFFDDKEIEISDEHMEYKWIAIDDIDKYKMKDGYRVSIKKFNDSKK